MVKNFKFIILFIFTSCFYSHAQTKPLSVGWELWYPYQFHNNDQQLVGLDLDIFNAIIAQANLTVNFTELPWQRHLNFIKTGQMDIAMGASHTSERADYAYFTKPYRSEKANLYVLKNQAKHIKLNELKELINSPYKIGVEAGYFYGNDYQQLIKNKAFASQINEVIDLEENILLLLAGKLDGVLVDELTMLTFIDKYKLENQFEPHDIPIYEDNIHIMLSKKTMNQAQLAKINQAIAVLKQNGTLAAIKNRWTNDLLHLVN